MVISARRQIQGLRVDWSWSKRKLERDREPQPLDAMLASVSQDNILADHRLDVTHQANARAGSP